MNGYELAHKYGEPEENRKRPPPGRLRLRTQKQYIQGSKPEKYNLGDCEAERIVLAGKEQIQDEKSQDYLEY